MPYSLILASKSPRRQYLLKEAGFDFAIKTMETDETYPDTLKAEEVAAYLAKKKAAAFVPLLSENEVVITADTVVILKDTILGKPKDGAEAKKMLIALSGQQHIVKTGVCIAGNKKMVVFDDTTSVYFKSLTKAAIDYYVNNFRPFDKAGAYGIQEWIGMIGIEKIEGSYFNVMGLPIHLLYEELNRF